MQKILPCLWFNDQAETAAKFYTTLFKSSKVGRVAYYGESGARVSGMKKDTVLTVEFEIEGWKILGLNGGPRFQFTPALSFMVSCETEEEIDTLWKKLSEGGTVRMGLDKYPWSTKYGWTADRFGVEWQLNLTPGLKKICPALLFVDEKFGKGEEALRFYQSVFPRSEIKDISRDEQTKSIQYCRFTLAGDEFVLMEGQGKHGFTFSLAFSFIVNCDSQKEIDEYWAKLSAGGEPSQCGWLEDKFGISWQVNPREMGDWVSDPKRSEAVMKATLQMQKIDRDKLLRVYEGKE